MGNSDSVTHIGVIDSQLVTILKNSADKPIDYKTIFNNLCKGLKDADTTGDIIDPYKINKSSKNCF